MNFRTERVNSEMKKGITNIINNKLKDPRITQMVTVVKMDVAKDLKTAKCYLSIYGDKESTSSTFEAICRCAGYIRKELAHDFKELRTIPEITFLQDHSMEYSQNINELLESIKNNGNN